MVKPSAKADLGLAVLEYSGLSTASGAAAADQMATATGTTTTARAVSSGATAATTAPNELSVGFYSDSGFGDTLTAGPGYTGRVNVARPRSTPAASARVHRLSWGRHNSRTAPTRKKLYRVSVRISEL